MRVLPCFILVLCLLLGSFSASTSTAQTQMTRSDLEVIGRKIWQSESAGKISGLTAWNSGESFASLGIGHFIWYPKGQEGPFDESFPQLIAYFKQLRISMPQWLHETADCPWNDRAAFLKDSSSTRQQELRDLLARTIPEQTQFIINRLEAATPKMVAGAGPAGQRVQNNIRLLRQSRAGNYAMIDYVNFKGDGLNPSESYKGQGWGLLQVLMEMQATSAADAPKHFANAAGKVLTRRVENSPSARNEKQWLKGWLNRCRAYGTD